MSLVVPERERERERETETDRDRETEKQKEEEMCEVNRILLNPVKITSST